jgi:transcription-repair coupling factor (superfamily II helicase)
MALSSIQDISIMTTPPKGRQPIHTELIKDDWNIISTAIQKEVGRGGQVYFVHNRVQTLRSTYSRLTSLLPGIRILIAHGQMPPQELDKVMTEFYQHKADILLCTTIIENGLDMPNVNTIIIDRAHTLGLAQLYQLRGRVGRSDKKAYCYLFYEGKTLKEAYVNIDEMTDGKGDTVKRKYEIAKYIERLKGLVDATELGAGFQVASRDLELRGAGNILGQEQHGHMSKLGYGLYMKLLGTEIEKLKSLVDQRIEYLTI